VHSALTRELLCPFAACSSNCKVAPSRHELKLRFIEWPPPTSPRPLAALVTHFYFFFFDLCGSFSIDPGDVIVWTIGILRLPEDANDRVARRLFWGVGFYPHWVSLSYPLLFAGLTRRKPTGLPFFPALLLLWYVIFLPAGS